MNNSDSYSIESGEEDLKILQQQEEEEYYQEMQRRSDDDNERGFMSGFTLNPIPARPES
jgi:hypothetical protein